MYIYRAGIDDEMITVGHQSFKAFIMRDETIESRVLWAFLALLEGNEWQGLRYLRICRWINPIMYPLSHYDCCGIAYTENRATRNESHVDMKSGLDCQIWDVLDVVQHLDHLLKSFER